MSTVYVCISESLNACINFSVYDRAGSKIKDVSENSGYSSNKSLFSKFQITLDTIIEMECMATLSQA